ncbi:MAG: sulfate transporter CysZ [Gammaproteobacteria bacterium]|nr:sulfate transporter CysZ [Gammaproteobacteria bacterium]
MINYLIGFSECFSGFGLIFLPGIRRFVIIPLLINISLFTGAIYLLSQKMDEWIQSLLPSWLSWLEWLIWPLFATTALLFVFYSFTLIANLIAAPFNSLLAARVEAHLSGKPIEDINTEKLWKLVIRSFASEIHKLLYFLMWLIPLIILTLIPGLNLIAPFAWFIFTTWSFSLEYMDYPLSNHGLLFKDIRQYNRQHRMRALGLGSGIFIITSVPVLNFLAMPVAVAGATKLTTQTKKEPSEI